MHCQKTNVVSVWWWSQNLLKPLGKSRRWSFTVEGECINLQGAPGKHACTPIPNWLCMRGRDNTGVDPSCGPLLQETSVIFHYVTVVQLNLTSCSIFSQVHIGTLWMQRLNFHFQIDFRVVGSLCHSKKIPFHLTFVAQSCKVIIHM